MTKMTIGTLSRLLAKIDVAMLTTRSAEGILRTRPMSNNGRVEFDGDSFYFAREGSDAVGDIAEAAPVSLSFQSSGTIFSLPTLQVAVEGSASIVRDPIQFADRWSPGLIRWFPDGVITPGLVMIYVRAERIRYWRGEDSGLLIV